MTDSTVGRIPSGNVHPFSGSCKDSSSGRLDVSGIWKSFTRYISSVQMPWVVSVKNVFASASSAFKGAVASANSLNRAKITSVVHETAREVAFDAKLAAKNAFAYIIPSDPLGALIPKQEIVATKEEIEAFDQFTKSEKKLGKESLKNLERFFYKTGFNTQNLKTVTAPITKKRIIEILKNDTGYNVLESTVTRVHAASRRPEYAFIKKNLLELTREIKLHTLQDPDGFVDNGELDD